MIKDKIISGIYAIQSILTGKMYIGQAVNISKRKYDHFYRLKRNNHNNKKLQSYYNKYGKENFVFLVLMSCPVEKLNFWENFWIKSFDSIKDGFNNVIGGKVGKRGGKRQHIFQDIFTNKKVKKTCDEFAIYIDTHVGYVRRLTQGRAKCIKNWICPKNKWRPKHKYTIIDPKGRQYEIYKEFLIIFCKENNLNYDAFWKLVSRKAESSQGWTRLDSKINKDRYKKFKFVNPEGKLIEGQNIEEFAKKHGLSSRCLCYVNNGEKYQHKGWRKYNSTKDLIAFKVEKYKITIDNIEYKTHSLLNFSNNHDIKYHALLRILNNQLGKEDKNIYKHIKIENI